MKEFPVSSLKPRFASLFTGNLNKPAIEIHFEPFTVQYQFEGETISDDFDQPLRADFVDLPTTNLAELLGQVFEFPINPDDGCIDASLYFRHAHNPIDISQLEFGKDAGGEFTMTVASRWLMTFEGTAPNDFDYRFTVRLNCGRRRPRSG